MLPRQGNKLIEYDIACSQLILLAGLAGEDSLIQYYTSTTDLYTFIFSKILGKSRITPEERKVYKTIILQILYGAGVDTIREQVQGSECKMTQNDIMGFSRKFYRLFPAIRRYIECVKTVEEIILPTRKYDMNNIKPYARLSHILQYVEAEILRRILIGLNEKSKELKFDIYLCIHDSVIIETGNEDIIEIREFVQECFNGALKKNFNNIGNLIVKEILLYV